MNNKKTQKNVSYFCEICEFKTDNKTDYNRHILRPKHLNNKFLIKNDNEKTPQLTNYICSCGKEYKYQSGLCAHKKKCFNNIKNNNNNNENVIINKDNTEITP
jgi:hypothetical protein